MGRRILKYASFLALLAACIAGVLFGSIWLREEARQTWLDQANRTVSRTTDVAVFWLTLFHAQLRGVGTLFYGSSEVTQDELFDALEVTESIEAAIPLTSVAFVEPIEASGLAIRMSTDMSGHLSAGSDLSDRPEIRDAVTRALETPDNVVMSRVYRDDADRPTVVLAFAAPNRGTDGALVTAVDLVALIDGLYALHIPKGIRLRICDLPAGVVGREPDRPFIGGPNPPPETAHSFDIITDSGQSQWEFHWDVLPEFRGGPHTLFADAVLWSGLIVIGLAFGLIALLSLQNTRVSRLVAERSAELRESEKRVSTILETSAEGFLFVDSTTVVRDVNETMCEILGRPREDVIGQTVFDFVDEENAEILREQIAIRDQGQKSAYEITISRPDGSTVPCLVSTTPYYDAEGGEVSSSAMVTDITELKKAESEIFNAMKEAEKAAQEAEAANSAKSVFLANISHEIRTPLNAIMGFAEILDRSLPDPRHKEQLNSIQSSGAALLALINDILDLTRLEAGDLELDWSPVDTQKVFSDVEEKYAPRAAQKGLEFRMELDAGLPKSIIADEKRLRQVIGNLVDNAIKFTDSGRVLIGARAVPSADNAETVDLSFDVQDTGVGIPDDQTDEVLEAFTQRRGQSINEYGGTGLGLALVNRLLSAMNGRVAVTSQVDVGSTFRVTLDGVSVADAATLGDLEVQAEKELVEQQVPEEAAWSPADLGTEARARLPELHGRLQGHEETARRLASTLTINDLDEFSALMQALGEEYAYPPLLAWGQKLESQTSMFDMDEIGRTLESYPEIFTELQSAIGA